MIRVLFLLLLVPLFNSQKEDKLYFGKSHNHSTIYSYSVTEIYISSDSIMTRLDYKLPHKKEWRNYKSYTPKIEVSKISKKGKYYSILDPETGAENAIHCLKITDDKLTYYYMESKDSFVKGYTFRRKR